MNKVNEWNSGAADTKFLEVESRPFWKDQWTDSIVFEFLERHGFQMVAQDRESPEQYNVIFVKL